MQRLLCRADPPPLQQVGLQGLQVAALREHPDIPGGLGSVPRGVSPMEGDGEVLGQHAQAVSLVQRSPQSQGLGQGLGQGLTHSVAAPQGLNLHRDVLAAHALGEGHLALYGAEMGLGEGRDKGCREGVKVGVHGELPGAEVRARHRGGKEGGKEGERGGKKDSDWGAERCSPTGRYSFNFIPKLNAFCGPNARFRAILALFNFTLKLNFRRLWEERVKWGGRGAFPLSFNFTLKLNALVGWVFQSLQRR